MSAQRSSMRWNPTGVAQSIGSLQRGLRLVSLFEEGYGNKSAESFRATLRHQHAVLHAHDFYISVLVASWILAIAGWRHAAVGTG